MSFKDDIEADLDVFFDTDEFASTHLVNGVSMEIVIDNDLIKERQAKSTNSPNGVYEGEILFHVKASAFGEKPAISQVVNLDGDIYRVSDAQEDDGMYSITLLGNQS
jgi:hypothetical protein